MTRGKLLIVDGYLNERPGIIIKQDALIVDKTEQALLDSDDGIYVRGHGLVQVLEHVPGEGGTRASPIDKDNLRERCDRAAYFMGHDKNGQLIKKLPPDWVVKMLLARGEWPFPRLAGISQTPLFRPDGTVVEDSGYDPSTGYLLSLQSKYPPIPKAPSLSDARGALESLKSVFVDFPFLALSDMAATLAIILTLVGRAAIAGPTPLFQIGSTTRGAGKGLLADTAATIAAGKTPARTANRSCDEEWDKRLLALALAAEPLVLIDNVSGELGSPALAAALTATHYAGRYLGKSKSVSAPLRPVWIATGNNIQLVHDLGRRVVPIDIDPEMENPEDRTAFTYPELLVHTRTQHPALLSSALTLLSAYHQADRPRHGLPRMGSFESWDDLARGALIWARPETATNAEFDPLGGIHRIREHGDGDALAAGAVVGAWQRAFGVGAQIIARAIEMAEYEADLRVALLGIQRRPSIKPDPNQVGRAIAQLEGRIVDGLRFVRDGKTGGAVRWRVEEVARG